jgi:predicted nucleotidyltransferase
MDREQTVALLRAHEAELKAVGVARLSIFGSVARGDATASSDVDVVIRLSPEAAQGGFAYFGRLDTINRRLEEILGCFVDVVAEPVRKERLRQTIEREARLAF